MPDAYDAAPIFSFLSELGRNNRKAWFDAHRDRYEDARTRFEDLLERIIEGLRKPYDLQGLTAKDCVARRWPPSRPWRCVPVGQPREDPLPQSAPRC